MARDRSPLSQRLKSLAQRAGRPDEETEPAPNPDLSPTATFSAPAQDDEQPTGEVPVIAEQPTDEQPAVTLAPESPVPPQPVVAPPAVEHPTVLSEVVTPAPESGPTLSPPVLPPRDIPAAPPLDPGAPPPSQPEADVDSEEPFSGATIWPQSSPTPNFGAPADVPSEPEPPTFPEPSPEPAEVDASAGIDDAPTVNAAAIEIPAEPTAAPDPTAGAGAAPDESAKPARSGGLLRRLRPGREDSAVAVADAPPAAAPVRYVEAEDPRPAILPPSPEPPAKPTFGERAALRRRAKSLRARRDAGLLELGAIVLDQRRFGDPTGGSLMRKRTDELADIDSELAAIEQVLDDDGPAETVAQLGVVRCLTCTSLLGPSDRFCVQCGAPRPEDAAPRNHS